MVVESELEIGKPVAKRGRRVDVSDLSEVRNEIGAGKKTNAEMWLTYRHHFGVHRFLATSKRGHPGRAESRRDARHGRLFVVASQHRYLRDMAVRREGDGQLARRRDGAVTVVDAV